MEERNVILTVNLSDILTSALSKWRYILLIGLLCGAAMLINEVRLDSISRKNASRLVFAPEPSNTDIADELERAFLADNLEAVQKTVRGIKRLVSSNKEYQNASLFMQIDPYATPRTRGDFIIRVPEGATESRMLQLADSYIKTSGDYEYLTDLAEAMGTEPRYIQEMYNLSVVDNALTEAEADENGQEAEVVYPEIVALSEEKYESVTLELLVRGRTAAEAEKIYSVVSEIITEKVPSAIGSSLEHTIEACSPVNEIVRDKWLADQQTNVYKTVANYDNAITTARTNNEKLQKPGRRRFRIFQARERGVDLKNVIRAGLAGLLAAVILFIVAALLTPYVIGSDEPNARYGLDKLGVFSRDIKARPFSAVDRFIYRHIGGDSFDTDEHLDRYAAMNIMDRTRDVTRLVLAPEGASEEEAREIAERLGDASSWAGGALREFAVSENVEKLTIDNPNGLDAAGDKVVLVLKRNVTRKKDLRHSIVQLHRFGREVAGYLML